MNRCPNVVTWIELGTRVRCHRPEGHTAEHRDRLWGWDDNSIRVDGSDHRDTAPPDRGHRSLTRQHVLAIRDRLDDGETIAQVARRMQLPYGTVRSVAKGITYRDVRRERVSA